MLLKEIRDNVVKAWFDVMISPNAIYLFIYFLLEIVQYMDVNSKRTMNGDESLTN